MTARFTPRLAHLRWLLASALALPGSLVGQQTAPLVLRLPASARLAGLADAYVGGSGPDMVFVNPARIGEGPGLLLSAGRYAGASTDAALASTQPLGKLAVGAFARWLDFGADGFPTRPGALTERGADDAQSLAAGVAAARTIGGFQIGAAVSYLEERRPVARAGTAAFDLGVAHRFLGATAGLVVQHLGAGLDLAGAEADLPTRVTLGVSTRRRPIGTFFDLLATAALSRERDGTLTPAGAAELVYEPVAGWTASIRLGVRRVDGAGRPGLQPVTLGGSLGLDRFALDYAYESYRGTGAVHRLGIRLQAR